MTILSADPSRLSGHSIGVSGYPTSMVAARLPDAAFNRAMESIFRKDDPDRVIPWSASRPPEWAREFHPRVLLDLGSGLGGMAASALTRLSQWGCLDRLERVILTERETNLHPRGADGLRKFLRRRIQRRLRILGLTTVLVEAHVENLIVRHEGEVLDLYPLERICPRADLVLGSHVSYYFDDGSGRTLVEAITRRISLDGRLWLNIRDLKCPVYQQREAALASMGIPEPRPFDNSEYFRDHVLPGLESVRLVGSAKAHLHFRPHTDRIYAIGLLMWRADVSGRGHMDPMFSSACEIAALDEPVYSDTQFILQPT